MAKPPYGGWVSFTVHLAKKYNLPLYKIGKRTERLKNGELRMRNFGYGVKYTNISIEDASKLDNILITAIDKKYYEYLNSFPNNTGLVIHDPTEVKGKSTGPVINNLDRFKIFTIRKTVEKYLKSKFNVNSLFLHHPFYEYPKSLNSKKTNNIATSRIDFDKHTDQILLANQNLDVDKKVTIYGAKNDLYVYHHLTKKLGLDINENYGGTFPKSFEYLDSILNNAKYVVDLSAIKNDGGGSQYTFLEAIYQGAVLVLNNKWIDGTNSIFKDKENCLVVSNSEELVKVLNKKTNTKKLAKNALKLLKPHTEVRWDLIFE